MRETKGITMIALTITIVVMIILAGVTINYGMDLLKNVKLQDLRTNMLLIQAKAKEYVEEVNFQLVNVTDETKKDQIKSENLKGISLTDSTIDSNVVSAAEVTGKIEGEKADYYYLTPENLNEMGLEEMNPEEYGYFIVKYDIENISVDVINTKGYQGNYTLEQLNSLTGEE